MYNIQSYSTGKNYAFWCLHLLILIVLNVEEKLRGSSFSFPYRTGNLTLLTVNRIEIS